MKPKHRFFIGIFFPLIGLLLSLPPYVPPIEKFILISILFFYGIGFFFLSFFLLDYLRNEIRSSRTGKFFRFLLVNLVLWGYFAGFASVSFLSFAGGILGPKFVRAEEFPDLGTSIYIYDASFFGKSVAIRDKNPAFPYISRLVVTLDDIDPANMTISRVEDKIRITPSIGKIYIYNSQTRQLFRDN